MRSQLTRRVFLQLLSPEGLIFHCPAHAPFRRRPHASRTVIYPPSRRAFWGFSRKTKQESKSASLDPGFLKLNELSRMKRMRTRPPPAAELVFAWREYMAHKEKRKEGFNTHHASLLFGTLSHLRELKSEDPKEMLNREDLMLAQPALLRIPKSGDLQWHAKLARLIHATVQEVWLRERGQSEEKLNPYSKFLVQALAQTGFATEARDLVMEFASSGNLSQKKPHTMWTLVMEGLLKENNKEELLRTMEIARSHVSPEHWPVLIQMLVKFYAKRGNVVAAKEWYEKAMDSRPDPATGAPDYLSASMLQTILQLCVKANELEWCKEVFKHAIANTPKKKHWDVILQWAAGGLGKGVEDVDRMMQVMLDRGQQRPDIATINGLVEMAMSLDDAYLAERYISLGKKWGIQPNADTYILQMEYRAGAKDLRGAQAAYEALATEEVLDDADLPAINMYIRALCAAKEPNYDLLSSINADLVERNKRLEPSTVVALSRVLLNYQEIQALVDILQANVYHYNMEERANVLAAFVAYCLDPWNSTAKTWDAYQLFRIVFDETEIDIRTKMMNEFFRRRRGDMACHVFGHMRQHDSPAKRPVLETYVQCFVGIAKMKDQEHLDMVHNMLKLDSSIEPNTKLYNALMLAFTACNDAHRAYQFWEDITMSHEGPSYNSLEIVFWSCANMPFGDDKARTIWMKMRRMQVEVTKEVFASYMGALARMGAWEEITSLLEGCKTDFGFEVDKLMLGTMYNVLPSQKRRDTLEEYAKEKFPEAWAELRKHGRYKTSRGSMRYFQMKIERNP